MAHATDSLANSLRSLPPSELRKAISGLTDADAYSLLYDWGFWARPNQLAPESDWRTWLILAGRGFGKTKSGAEWIRYKVQTSKQPLRIALVGRTSADCRKTMVEGESGILSVFPLSQQPVYVPSQRQITFPNGSIAITYSSEEPNLLRGPSHSIAWIDEVATFYDADVDEKSVGPEGTTWSNLQFGLRLGGNPQQLVTTTPRPIRLLKELIADPSTVVTRGTTYENRDNMAPEFFSAIISRYEGTRLGRQELMGEVLEDLEGSLWQRSAIQYKTLD